MRRVAFLKLVRSDPNPNPNPNIVQMVKEKSVLNAWVRHDGTSVPSSTLDPTNKLSKAHIFGLRETSLKPVLQLRRKPVLLKRFKKMSCLVEFCFCMSHPSLKP